MSQTLNIPVKLPGQYADVVKMHFKQARKKIKEGTEDSANTALIGFNILIRTIGPEVTVLLQSLEKGLCVANVEFLIEVLVSSSGTRHIARATSPTSSVWGSTNRCSIGIQRTDKGIAIVVGEWRGDRRSTATKIARELSKAFGQQVTVLSDSEFQTWWEETNT